MSNTDVYEEVTEAVIAALENGTVPWHKPWNAPADMPTSLSTGKAYRGINSFLLTMMQQSKGYTSPYWGTYKQISERGGQVQKGEKSTGIVFWKFLEKEDKETGIKSTIPLLRTYRVFNADQQEGARLPEMPEPGDFEPIELAEYVAKQYLATGPAFRNAGDRAFYMPGADSITVPDPGWFSSPEEYYSTLFHEMTHSTGHKSRLARPTLLESHYFGDPNYSREELVAEMGAAMLCGTVGIHQSTVPMSASYVASWLKVLREDNKAVIVAAGQAQKAADLIQGKEMEGNNGAA